MKQYVWHSRINSRENLMVGKLAKEGEFWGGELHLFRGPNENKQGPWVSASYSIRNDNSGEPQWEKVHIHTLYNADRQEERYYGENSFLMGRVYKLCSDFEKDLAEWLRGAVEKLQI